MKTRLVGLLVLFILIGCHVDKTSSEGVDVIADATEDSVLSPLEVDTIHVDTVHKDGMFDEFLYSFMTDSIFQKERVIFPLVYKKNNVSSVYVDKTKWTYDPLYLKQEVYTLIFDDENSLKAEKDTALHLISFEWVYLRSGKIKQYDFIRNNYKWFLSLIKEFNFSQSVNEDFYSFYRAFSSDSLFQEMHISDPFYFKTYDSENLQYIEGLLDRNQWQDYKPDLPQNLLTNINYSQNYSSSNKRVLIICNPSGGMGCSLTFVRNEKHEWMLQRLEN